MPKASNKWQISYLGSVYKAKEAPFSSESNVTGMQSENHRYSATFFRIKDPLPSGQKATFFMEIWQMLTNRQEGRKVVCS